MLNKRLIALIVMFALILGIFGFIGSLQTKNNSQEISENVTLTVNAANKTQNWTYSLENETAMQLLQKNNKLNISSSSHGTFADCINEICSNTKYFWVYYVNGNLSSISPSDYYIKKGDSIEFRYEKI